LLRIGLNANLQDAERNMCEALAVARAQGSRSLELRAANSVARLWLRQDRGREAGLLLKPIVEWFAEGPETTDIREAATILAKRASHA
jgi:predicted ATPase